MNDNETDYAMMSNGELMDEITSIIWDLQDNADSIKKSLDIKQIRKLANQILKDTKDLDDCTNFLDIDY